MAIGRSSPRPHSSVPPDPRAVSGGTPGAVPSAAAAAAAAVVAADGYGRLLPERAVWRATRRASCAPASAPSQPAVAPLLCAPVSNSISAALTADRYGRRGCHSMGAATSWRMESALRDSERPPDSALRRSISMTARSILRSDLPPASPMSQLLVSANQ